MGSGSSWSRPRDGFVKPHSSIAVTVARVSSSQQPSPYPLLSPDPAPLSSRRTAVLPTPSQAFAIPVLQPVPPAVTFPPRISSLGRLVLFSLIGIGRSNSCTEKHQEEANGLAAVKPEHLQEGLQRSLCSFKDKAALPKSKTKDVECFWTFTAIMLWLVSCEKL
ncbi:unnamed protein product [Cuscuta campestris]|uniref:Uncharacterized protein n=1 Tax=Cuscuta campestris TaxID=132261 RepID=A0A484MWF6_9ASTE|nr:unnamed protein product [Cuscuta campestris]